MFSDTQNSQLRDHRIIRVGIGPEAFSTPSHSDGVILEPPIRIERMTCSLQVSCSTTELGRRVAGVIMAVIVEL